MQYYFIDSTGKRKPPANRGAILRGRNACIPAVDTSRPSKKKFGIPHTWGNIVILPLLPSRRMRCPFIRRSVAWWTPTTAGMPYSRATTEP